jgi:hypothetical protein
MNTKTFNHFRNIFAFIGFFIIACSVGTVEDENPELPTPVQSNIGKYQITDNGNGSNVFVLNTANGQVKDYRWDGESWKIVTSFTATH